MEERGLINVPVDFPAGVFVPEDSSAARERAAGIR